MSASPPSASSTEEEACKSSPKLKKSTQLKKWVMAKMCEYKNGRQLIHKMTGNVGVDVIDATHRVVLMHSGKCVADDLVLQLYKVICKAGVLITEKEITNEVHAVINLILAPKLLYDMI
jgi:hypothetical protein